MWAGGPGERPSSKVGIDEFECDVVVRGKALVGRVVFFFFFLEGIKDQKNAEL